jgi:hypothetical protein
MPFYGMFVKITEFNGRDSHKEHKGREDHKEGIKVFVRYLVVKVMLSLQTTTPYFSFVIFVPL